MPVSLWPGGIAILNGTQSTIISYPELTDTTSDGKYKYPTDSAGELTDRGETMPSNVMNSSTIQLAKTMLHASLSS
jgi:hypothetical protein